MRTIIAVRPFQTILEFGGSTRIIRESTNPRETVEKLLEKEHLGLMTRDEAWTALERHPHPGGDLICLSEESKHEFTVLKRNPAGVVCESSVVASKVTGMVQWFAVKPI